MVVRIFWGKTREEKPKQIFAEDLDMNEERLKTHHGGRRPIKPLHEEAASLILPVDPSINSKPPDQKIVVVFLL